MENHPLYRKAATLLEGWESNGLPGTETIKAQARDLTAWRTAESIGALWQRPPVMIGTTIDDALGQGIEVILALAEALGCRTRFLGLRKPVADIVEAGRKEDADMVGVTVLRFDEETALTELRRKLDARILLIAGGPAFRADPEIADRAGVDFVGKSAAHFLRFLMHFKPSLIETQ